MSDNGSNVGVLVSIVSAVGSVFSIGTLIAIIRFWTQFSDRITIADQKAESAKQEAAEAKNEVASLREGFEEMVRDLHGEVEKLRRENGESLAAIRQHVTEVAFFMRDNFVRNDVFAAAMSKLEAGQLRAESKLDQIMINGKK